jgi:hypothetical protein
MSTNLGGKTKVIQERKKIKTKNILHAH